MMKVFAHIFSILFLLSCSDKKSANIQKQVSDLTEIQFEDDMHDFGKLESGEILAYSFIFTNTGNSDLVIKNAEADCGCVQVRFPKEPLKPNEQGKIEVEFDSSGLIGRQLKTIEIDANCKEPKHLVIFAEIKNNQIEINY